MNQEQIAKLKELARKAQIDSWPFYGVAYQKAASPDVVLELIALAERTTAPVSVMTDENASRPDLLERLTYHEHERDDMSIDDLLKTLSADGYKNVRQRTHRQLELQLLALLAAAPAPIQQAPQATLICPTCGKDRFKEPCPNMADECPMIADAHLLALPALAGSQVPGDAVDAARYRFLRDGANNGYHLKGETNIGKFHVTQKIRDGEGLFYHEEFLDAAIDAAMREQP